jgi:hypothetical protein
LTGFVSVVAQGKGHNLAGAATHHRPLPTWVDFGADETQASSPSKTSPGCQGKKSLEGGSTWGCSRIQTAICCRANPKIRVKPRKLARS